MRRLALVVGLAAALSLGGCGSTTGSRTLSGAMLGSAGGAFLGAMGGNAALGALVGAGAGALGGLLLDQSKKGNID